MNSPSHSFLHARLVMDIGLSMMLVARGCEHAKLANQQRTHQYVFACLCVCAIYAYGCICAFVWVLGECRTTANTRHNVFLAWNSCCSSNGVWIPVQPAPSSSECTKVKSFAWRCTKVERVKSVNDLLLHRAGRLENLTAAFEF